MNETDTREVCVQCGAQLYGPFCGKCGCRADAVPTPGPQAYAGLAQGMLQNPGGAPGADGAHTQGNGEPFGAWPPGGQGHDSRETVQSWKKPRRSAGGIALVVALCMLALGLFVVWPVGVILRGMMNANPAYAEDHEDGYDDFYDGYDDYGEFGAKGYGDTDLRATSSIHINVLGTARVEEEGAAPKGYHRVVVEVAMTNIGGEIVPYSTADFEILCSGGNLLAAIENQSNLGTGRIFPEGMVTGSLCFFVPQSEFGSALFFTDANEESLLYPLL